MSGLDFERCIDLRTRAWDNHERAQESVAQLSTELGELVGRLEGARTRHASALAALRARDLAEDIAAARMAVAQADSVSLQQMISALQPRLDQAVRARDQALEQEQRAAADLERAKAAMAAEALDERIEQILEESAARRAAILEHFKIKESV